MNKAASFIRPDEGGGSVGCGCAGEEGSSLLLLLGCEEEDDEDDGTKEALERVSVAR